MARNVLIKDTTFVGTPRRIMELLTLLQAGAGTGNTQIVGAMFIDVPDDATAAQVAELITKSGRVKRGGLAT